MFWVKMIFFLAVQKAFLKINGEDLWNELSGVGAGGTSYNGLQGRLRPGFRHKKG